MKNTLKTICGMSLVMALTILSFLIMNGNESMAADAKIVIKTGEAASTDCQWKLWLDFGEVTSSATDQTKTTTWQLSHAYVSSIKQTCSIWLNADLSNWAQSIAKSNLTVSWNTLANPSAGNLNTNSALTWAWGNLSGDKTIYIKDAWKVWTSTQQINGTLTIPAYRAAWTYKATLKATATTN